MWDLIVSVPDHCLSFYFEGCFQFILREYLYLNLKWWTNSYFIQVVIKNHANLVSAVMNSM